MRNAIKAARRKLTRRNCWWFLKCNLQSWVIQGALVGGLTVCGVGAVAAVVSAKVTAYAVFLGQCMQAARAK